MKAVILAAGLSRRMKTQKLLLPFGRGTVLSTVVYNVLGAGFDGIVLVVSRDTKGIGASLSPQLTEVVNESPEQGQASSLKLGVAAVGDDDFCMMLADVPLVTSREILRHRALFTARDAKKYTALVPRRDGRLGHPSFFAARWRERFLDAEGDVGGRGVLMAYGGEILYVEGEESFFVDIDTPEEYGQITAERL